ncbi:MAG: LytR C-terminal domain-containing protein [bacterium]|nr:LytR C-terminal domain-containing protein [bacterium]
MNRIILLALTLIFANSTLATAATPTLAGPSGLVLTRTAEILDKGEHSATVYGIMDKYEVDEGEKVSDTEYLGAFHFLMFENLELGVIASMLQPDTENISRSETSYLNGIGKVRLAGGRDRGYGIAASGYASLNRYKADPLVSSGEDIYGGELNVSFFGEGASLHLAAGAKQDDVRAFTLVSSTFVYAKQKYVTVAVEMTPTPDFSYSLEWMRSTINEKDNVTHLSEIYQMVMLSAKYSVNKFTFSVGAGMEIPDKDADPEYDHFKYLLGITYGYNKPKEAAPKPAVIPAGMPSNSPITAPFNSISRELDELRGEIEDIKNNKSKLTEEEAIAQPMLEPVDAVETEAGAPVEATAVAAVAAKTPTKKGSNPYTYLRVEVINVSGIAGLGENVARILEKAGFNVVKVESLEVSNKSKSFILHKKEFINEGVMVAREIPKDQDVLVSKRLSSKVDVRVVAGKDLEFLMKK